MTNWSRNDCGFGTDPCKLFMNEGKIRNIMYAVYINESCNRINLMLQLSFKNALYFSAMFDMSRETDIGVSLYSRKVLIMARANHVLPKYLRFIRGEA